MRNAKQMAAEERLRAVHAMLKLKQRSPEAAAAIKEFARAEVEKYEAALREQQSTA